MTPDVVGAYRTAVPSLPSPEEIAQEPACAMFKRFHGQDRWFYPDDLSDAREFADRFGARPVHPWKTDDEQRGPVFPWKRNEVLR